jgi:hypothetical protein
VSTIDPYAILGVARGADPETIRRAYRRLAWRHHPDHGGSTARMRELNAAYARLRAAVAGRVASDPLSSPGPRTPFASRRTRAASWLAGTQAGQWVVTVVGGLAVHAVAIWATPSASHPLVLEALTLVLALRLQASATPVGHTFAPTRDLVEVAVGVLRAVSGLIARW